MKTLPLTEPVTLNIPSLPRAALDELYHFMQYLQFKYKADLEDALEVLEDEIDGFDADVALREPGALAKPSPLGNRARQPETRTRSETTVCYLSSSIRASNPAWIK